MAGALPTNTVATRPMGEASVITVNGVTIGEEAIAAEVQYHPAASLEEARRAAAPHRSWWKHP